jgi:hypothetical protein
VWRGHANAKPQAANLFMRRVDLAIGALLTGGVLAVYGPTIQFEFVNYDDPVYVLQNINIQETIDIESVAALFGPAARRQGHWHPLTWLSLMIDYRTYGLNPAGFHATNVGLHLANTLLVYALLRWTTGAAWRSAAVAALFALHPLHVESVAWVTARKDVLCTFFSLLAMLAYCWHAKQPRRDRYLRVLLAFALALLSKSMALTLPCVLLLLDYWPLGRFSFAPPTVWRGAEPRLTWPRLLLEKAPLLLMAGAAAFLAGAGMRDAQVLRSQPALAERLTNVVITYVVYLRKTFWPSDLAPFYPPQAWTGLAVLGSALVLVGISLAAWSLRRRCPAFLVGWLWYVGTLVPVIGFVKLGAQAYADRYTYVPLIGVFIALVWLLESTARWRWLVATIALVVIIGCGVLAFRQTQVWRPHQSRRGAGRSRPVGRGARSL